MEKNWAALMAEGCIPAELPVSVTNCNFLWRALRDNFQGGELRDDFR